MKLGLCKLSTVFHKREEPGYSKVRYFFPRKSLGGTHSLTLGNFFFRVRGEKKNKLFFRKNWTKFCFFFAPGKVYPSLTHSISEGGRKKNSAGKKTAFSLTHSKNHKKVQILNFSGKKKNTVPLVGGI